MIMLNNEPKENQFKNSKSYAWNYLFMEVGKDRPFFKKKIQNSSENVSHKLLPADVNNLDMILF